MGYETPDIAIINLPDGKVQKPGSAENAPTMEIVREKAFTITYKVMERMKNLKPRGTKIFAHNNEGGDIELQYNLFTLSTTIVYLECQSTTRSKEGYANISIEVIRYNIFMALLTIFIGLYRSLSTTALL